MKLLIVTQAVDTEDPVLGFFVRWIEEFAKHIEHIEVICLKEGKYHLPENVRVHSLGKENGPASRVGYSLRFLKLVWKLRNEYDTIFVHMNPEYVVLGGLLWRTLGKHIAFWYNHPQKGIRLSLAALLAHKIFHTSQYAATAHFRKAKRMPAGIDTAVFKPEPVERNRNSLYMQGRIMPSKRVDIAIEALQYVREKVPGATLTLVGPEDLSYGKELRKRFSDVIASNAVIFAGSKKNTETPVLYSGAGISINLAASGHFDKSVLESMACETPVVLSSKAFADSIPSEWVVPENDSVALAIALVRLMTLPEDQYVSLGRNERSMVERSQGLSELANRLVQALEEI